jgi:hypothetical protein
MGLDRSLSVRGVGCESSNGLGSVSLGLYRGRQRAASVSALAATDKLRECFPRNNPVCIIERNRIAPGRVLREWAVCLLDRCARQGPD